MTAYHYPALKTPEGQAALAAIRERKLMSARKGQKVSRVIGALCLLAVLPSLYYFGPKPWTYFLPFGLFLLIEDGKPDSGLTEKEYYSIPGSRTSAGKHLCIYCGHHEKEVHHYGRTGSMTSIYCASCGKRAY
jgi:hypothetical protein